MNVLLGGLLAALLANAAPTVEVTTITGPARQGTLTSADASHWVVSVEGQDVTISTSEILEVQLKHEMPLPVTARPVEVRLGDGSRLGASQIRIADRTTTLSQKIKLPAASVLSIRFATSPSTVDSKWNELHDRERRQDMLVVQKGETLDFVEGTIGDVSNETLVLLLDGEKIEVPREKAFGVIFYRSTEESGRPSGFVELTGGDRLGIRSVAINGDTATAVLTAGAKVELPLTSIARFDLSTDKLTWLSTLEPRDVKHESRFIDPAPTMANDRDVWGEPLRIGKQSFARGVAIRSKTALRYRLNGDFTRLQALIGIQKGYRGDVRLELSLDGEQVFDQIVKPDEEPRPLDLDVSDRFNLDVLVDYGTLQSDIGDHLILGNARLLR
ncbi:MAG: NPCBM/NEW2 domain-containing protein [Planctomycetota bacterium]|jgi:hypothetical protein